MANSTGIYHSNGLCGPTKEDFVKLSEEMRFKCTTEELEGMAEHAKEVTQAFERVSRMVDSSTPLVKYPRTPGYRPQPAENPFNAWAWRCDIQGAAVGKLLGKSVGIKDNIAVAGIPLRNGSNILEGYVPEFDATVVTRILDAGGRITGKTSVEYLCLSGSSVTNSFGPVRNPNDESRITGGSSSGSGALVAGGYIDMALGGDQGGSIRIPSSFCGIVGLKPTYGLVPYTGAVGIATSLDHLGPMARTVKHCALLLEVIAGYDEGRDSRQSPNMAVLEYSTLIEGNVVGKKVGLVEEGFELCQEKAVADIVREAALRLNQVGITTEKISIPIHKNGADIWTAASFQDTYNCMIKCNGTGDFVKGFYPLSLQEAMFRGFTTSPQDVHPVIKFFSMYSEFLNRLYGNRFSSKGRNLALTLTKAYDEALKKYDVLIMPTLPHTATNIPSADVSFADLIRSCLSMCTNAMPFNLSGHPALTINAGRSSCNGMPVGMMIIGKKYDELTVLQVARAFENISAGK